MRINPRLVRRFCIVGMLWWAVVALTACTHNPLEYHQDISQGNILETRHVTALKIGMTRAEVERLLGSPVLQSPFESDAQQCEYVYYFQPGKGTRLQKRLTLTFGSGTLTRIHPQGAPLDLTPK